MAQRINVLVTEGKVERNCNAVVVGNLIVLSDKDGPQAFTKYSPTKWKELAKFATAGWEWAELQGMLEFVAI